MDLLERLIQLDKTVFTFIHRDLSVGWLDHFMLLMRNQYTWIPLYAYILYWTYKLDRRMGLKFIVLTLLCFGITDFVSASIIKPNVNRLRPCFDEELTTVIRGIIGCGGKHSFPSSHASNHFGLATFWFFAVQFITGKKWYWLWLWAFVIGLAQVYVGKHFPLDILGGAVLGIITGLGLFTLLKMWVKRDLNKHLKNPSVSLP